MNKNHSANPAEMLALERFGLITKIQDALHQQIPLGQAIQQTASAQTNPLSPRTLEDWWYAYKKGGFAALHPKGRCDRGQFRKCTPEQKKLILEQVQSHLRIPLSVLYRHWKQKDSFLPSLSTVYRILEQNQLNHKQRRAGFFPSMSGPTKSFEAPFSNDLWMVDFSPGPFLRPPDSAKAQATHLCLIIDDHSRLIPFAAYYPCADTQPFHQTLKQAIRRRGIPLKLYTDQGGPFTSDHTKIICANLGIRLLHAKPYHAWSKELVSYCASYELFSVLSFPAVPVLSHFDLGNDRFRWLPVKIIISIAEPTTCKQAHFSPIVDETRFAIQRDSDLAHGEPPLRAQTVPKALQVIILPQAIDDSRREPASATGTPTALIEQERDFSIGVLVQ